MAIFKRKPWVNPFGEMAIFGLLELFGFFNLDRRFFVLECRKRHFPGPYYLKKKKLQKLPFLSKSYGLTPLEKWPFSDFLNLLFL